MAKQVEDVVGAMQTCPVRPALDRYACLAYHVCMSHTTKLTRKSFFVDPSSLRRARKALRAKTDSEAVRVSLERVAEMEAFWRFMETTRGKLGAKSFEGA